MQLATHSMRVGRAAPLVAKAFVCHHRRTVSIDAFLGREKQAPGAGVGGAARRAPAPESTSSSSSTPTRVRQHGARVAAPQKRRPGPKFEPSQLHPKEVLGSGSYGQVFAGTLDLSPSSGGGVVDVVMKRVKADVPDAEEMGEAELLLNWRAKSAAPGAVAEYLGHCDAPEGAPIGRGLWLVWRREGTRTLAHVLARGRDALPALARALGVPEQAAPRVAMRQLLECLSALHASGCVHRDIKPANLILDERLRRLKLIDLGSMADLHKGTNFHPHEFIIDDNFAPNEVYLLPTSSPAISKSLLAPVLGRALWARHKPDRFDCWSAGVVLLMLTLAPLRDRGDAGLRRFREEMEACGYDLDEWRASCRWLSPKDFAALDADGGAGWALARGLLRPRHIEVAGDGAVEFVGGAMRMSAAEALRSPFVHLSQKKKDEKRIEVQRLAR